MVARSSAQAEFRVMAHEVCEVLWFKHVLKELRQPIIYPLRLYCDNKAAISIAHNPIQYDRTKYVEIDGLFFFFFDKQMIYIKRPIASRHTRSIQSYQPSKNNKTNQALLGG